MNTTPEQRTVVSEKKQRNIRVKRYSGLLRRRRKLYALLLAALIPGLGHIYLGMFRKGITFMMLLLLDVSALLYFSSIGMQINVPLLIVLGLLIPMGYFYNVYDVLQAAEYIISRKRRGEAAVLSSADGRSRGNPFRGERGIAFGIMLVTAGTMLILFHQKPAWLQMGIRDFGAEISAIVLIIAGLWAGVREALRHRRQDKGKSV